MALKWLNNAKRRFSKEIPTEGSSSTNKEPIKDNSGKQIENDPSPRDPASSSEQLSKTPTGRPVQAWQALTRKEDAVDEKRLRSGAIERAWSSPTQTSSRHDIDEVQMRHHKPTPDGPISSRAPSNTSLTSSRSTHRRGPVKSTGFDRISHPQQAEVHKYSDGSKLT